MNEEDAILTEWWLSNGVPFEAFLTETRLDVMADGTLLNLVCAYLAQGMGVVLPNSTETDVIVSHRFEHKFTF